jgi:ABC-type transporter Mla subunit MlaD
MPAEKSAAVTGTLGNVIFCNFGEAAETGGSDASLDEALTGIRAAIAEINGAVSDTLVVHAEASSLERDVAQLLLKALDSMDIVAFQSRILLAGATGRLDGDSGHVAASLWRFVAAGAAVSQRLQALAGEHRSWIGAEQRLLQEIVAHAGQLETTAADCIRTMRSVERQPDAVS